MQAIRNYRRAFQPYSMPVRIGAVALSAELPI
jgi:hypothetical protein